MVANCAATDCRISCLMARGVLAASLALFSVNVTAADNLCLPKPAAGLLSGTGRSGAETPAAETLASLPAWSLSAGSQEGLPLGVADSVHVYFDASGSMLGYVQTPKPASEAASIYSDLVLTLPIIAGRRTEQIYFYRFGEKILPLPAGDLTKVAEADFYRCIGGPGAQTCINQESRIADVFARADADVASAVHVILTDLFLSQEDLIGSAAAALRRPLTNALRSGKSIAVLAVKSAFNGIIYDLPSGGTYDKATSRPIFMVLVGDGEKISVLVEGLKAEVLSALEPEDVHFIQFRERFITRALDRPEDFKLSMGTGVKSNRSLLDSAFPFPQLELDRGAEPQVVRFDIAKILLPDGLSLRDFALTEQLWLKVNRDDCEQAWLELTEVPKVTEIVSDGPQMNIVLFGDTLSLRALPKRRSYLLHAEVTAYALSDVELDWANAWSFSARDEARLLDDEVTFFPALNLDRLFEVFKEIARERFEATRVAEFLIVFHPKR